MGRNWGYIYYQKMYEVVAQPAKKLGISEKYKKALLEKRSLPAPAPFANFHFDLVTTYPGLLLGTGYMHGISDENDYKMGFYFDYTTGLPVIPGSSIKGALRSAFKHQEYIESNLSEAGKDVKIDELEKSMFLEKDVYFDAIPFGDVKLADDYLAPHGQDTTKEPKPIQFLRVAPDVKYRFGFQLHDGVISAQKKMDLINRMILDLGLGAKTAVGYGSFIAIQ